MAVYQSPMQQQKKKKKRARRLAEAAKLRGAKIHLDEVDYKNLPLLQRLISSQGKLYSRKRTGLSAPLQRKVVQALKQARFLGLLPFVA